jgi:hypothetical protein
MTYRKKQGSDTWHYCRNCARWPTADYDQKTNRPTTGELCNECQAKDKAGTCTK